MPTLNDIEGSTTTCFDRVNFCELNDNWIDQVIDNEFTDTPENNITTSVLFVNDVIETLKKLTAVCESWCDRADSNHENLTSAETVESSNLWTFLEEMDISIRQLQGLIYLLSSRGKKQDSSLLDKEIGIAISKLYFTFLKNPGSTAYSMYHPNLYRLCIDCLIMPDLAESKEVSDSWRCAEKLMPAVCSALVSLIPLLRSFHLGSDSSLVEHTIKKLVELVACEVSNANINFDDDFVNVNVKDRKRRYTFSYVVAALAYQALSSLIESDLNGERDETYSVILSNLNRHILCSKIKKAATIPHKYLVVKENAVSYLCHNLKKNLDLYSAVTRTALKHLCLSVSHKSEFRSTVSQSVFKIMFSLLVDDLIELIQWLLLLVDSSDTNNRVFALELFGHVLINVNEVDLSSVPDSQRVYLTKFPVIFSILTRCDDVSPLVRTKALTLLSQYMKYILDFLGANKDNESAIDEEYGDDFEYDTDVNGNHRRFWYNLKSCRETLDEISSILHRRMEDNNATARKAAVQALENLVIFDQTYLNGDNFKFFICAAKDTNVTTRKQVIQSLTAVLEVFYNNSEVQECWLKCILPLVEDPENSVQVKALNVMEEQFLYNVFSNSEAKRECVFNLLKKLCFGELLSHEQYLQKAFSIWKSEKKLGSQNFKQLEKYFRTDGNECKWFYLAVLSVYSKVPLQICNFTMENFQSIQNNETWPPHMQYILKVLRCACSTLHLEKLTSIQSILREKLKSVAIPVEFIPLSIEVLCKVERHLNNEQEFEAFAIETIKICADYLSSVASENLDNESPSEDIIQKSLCTVQELCQSYPSSITEDLILTIKTLCFCNKSSASSTLHRVITPNLQAHSFAALGKVCLLDENLAREVLPSFAKELITSNEDVVRNNVVIIMIEMCKRFTAFADKYVHLICSCFKDKVYLIRYQAISLMISLLQEDFIKWKGNLFFCLLYTITDKKESIQELGKYCLGQLIYEKKRSVFADHFMDSIFVFNGFDHPQNQKLSRIVQEMKQFSLKGNKKKQQRVQIYKYMLGYMDISSRALLIKQLCEEVLTSVAETVFPLNAITVSMVKDCFAIISSKEIRVYNVDHISDELEEGEEDNFVKAELQARRIMIIDPIIPIIISLKNCVVHSQNNLVKEIVLFLKDILEDFKSDIKDILSADKELLYHIQNSIVKGNDELEMPIEHIPVDEETAKASPHSSSLASVCDTIMGKVQDPKPIVIDNVQLNSEPYVALTPLRLSADLGKEVIQLASTPCVRLYPLKVPPNLNISNISEIEKGCNNSLSSTNDDSED